MMSAVVLKTPVGGHAKPESIGFSYALFTRGSLAYAVPGVVICPRLWPKVASSSYGCLNTRHSHFVGAENLQSFVGVNMAHINYPPAVAETVKDFKEEVSALEFEVSNLYSVAPVGFISDVIECMAEQIGNMSGGMQTETEHAHFLPSWIERAGLDLNMMTSTLRFYSDFLTSKEKQAFLGVASHLAECGARAVHLSDTLLDHEN